jgi:hypothetical protein
MAVLDIIQTGSTSQTLSFRSDTITLELAETVQTPVLAVAIQNLQALGSILGITFAVNTSGNAT